MRTRNPNEEIKSDATPVIRRVPVNGSRDLLRVDGIPEHLHECWVNEDNVLRYMDGGYSFYDGEVRVGDVRVDTDTKFGKRWAKNVGNGVTAFLMVIPKEFHKEDLELISKDILERESILFRNSKTEQGRYGKGIQEEIAPTTVWKKPDA